MSDEDDCDCDDESSSESSDYGVNEEADIHVMGEGAADDDTPVMAPDSMYAGFQDPLPDDFYTSKGDEDKDKDDEEEGVVEDDFDE